VENLLMALLIWVSVQTSYPLDGIEIPTVEYNTAEELRTLVHSQNHEIVAVYGEGVIHVLPTFDKENAEDRATLVHELVHHLQRHHKVTYKCKSQYEAEAYMIEEMWRVQEEMRPTAPSPLIMLMASCQYQPY